MDGMDEVVLIGYGMAHRSSSVVTLIGSSLSFQSNEDIVDECRWMNCDGKHLLGSHGRHRWELASDEKWEKVSGMVKEWMESSGCKFSS